MPLRDIAAEAQWFIKMKNRYRSAIKEVILRLTQESTGKQYHVK